jgi:hypothetical protein
MSEILKLQLLEVADPSQVAGPLHHLQPEKPSRVMKCPH